MRQQDPENKELIVVGTTSKIGTFICKYPFRVMVIVIFATETLEIMVGADTIYLWRGLLILLSVCLPLLLLIYLMTNKWCYKIEIDRMNNELIFYRLFNRGVHAMPIDRIKIVIAAYCHIFVNDSEFILHVNYIHDLASYLPRDAVIDYKGSIGKYKRRYWEKNGKPLRPGSKLLQTN